MEVDKLQITATVLDRQVVAIADLDIRVVRTTVADHIMVIGRIMAVIRIKVISHNQGTIVTNQDIDRIVVKEDTIVVAERNLDSLEVANHKLAAHTITVGILKEHLATTHILNNLELVVITHITSSPVVVVGRMLEVDLGLMVEHRMLVVANRIDLDLVTPHSRL